VKWLATNLCQGKIKLDPGESEWMYELLENTNMVRFIISIKTVWLGHVMRMDDKRTPNRILEWKTISRKIRGRPRKRWIADIE